MPTDPVDYLNRLRNSADRKAKGDDGTRTTRDVAEACGLSMGAARRKLHAAFQDDRIEAFDEGASGHQGNMIYWQGKEAAQSAE